MSYIKISDFEEIFSLNDTDILEVSKFVVTDFESVNITVSEFRSSVGATPHTIVEHYDTTVTGTQLNTLSDGSNSDLLHSHDLDHTIQSHTDTDATGVQLDSLVDGSNADSLHSHNTNHVIQSHIDTDTTGSQLNTLTDGSNSDLLHSHDLSHDIEENHIDSIVTSEELDTLTDGSNSDLLHIHSLSSINYSSVIQSGTIVAVPYSTIPDGWLECDGSLLTKIVYVNLYTTLKNGGLTCIYGENTSEFMIPDLRGRFIRSTSNGSVIDPDRLSRTDRGDGVTGDVVGSLQTAEFKSHTHAYSRHLSSRKETEMDPGYQRPITYTSTLYDTTSYGGNETRPVNIALMYIIKI